MSNNFRKYPKTKARRIQGHSSTSLQIPRHSRPWIFVFKFKDIQGLSSFVRTLYTVITETSWKSFKNYNLPMQNSYCMGPPKLWYVQTSLNQWSIEFNMNKLMLVGIQLPEKYKENFDVSSEKSRRSARTIDILYKLDSASLLVKLKPRIFQRLPLFE
jgi:hypothetical protein